uniref:Uncharacterized protein n=1 Tax=Aegilops tauschii subsp. strangulata TaxID=200361 RepID=A0A453SZI7_AEGTS
STVSGATCHPTCKSTASTRQRVEVVLEEDVHVFGGRWVKGSYGRLSTRPATRALHLPPRCHFFPATNTPRVGFSRSNPIFRSTQHFQAHNQVGHDSQSRSSKLPC